MPETDAAETDRAIDALLTDERTISMFTDDPLEWVSLLETAKTVVVRMPDPVPADAWWPEALDKNVAFLTGQVLDLIDEDEDEDEQ